ncbi:hypothetical protein [Oleomonas cavernae]|uniref:hypothetical protein n=1 Tax=Oleomonas cavernae TaxID=2320859 RepID=UPI001F307D90|nr:hypothetical protein [Oleomonas cavernae]
MARSVGGALFCRCPGPGPAHGRAGFDALGGTRLFRLYRHDEAAAWFERLGKAGILVRPFDYQPDWLRLGLPGDKASWARLEEALR